MTPTSDTVITLESLIEEYGRAQALAGRLLADILHRVRMLHVFADVSQVADPTAPLPPLPRESPPSRVAGPPAPQPARRRGRPPKRGNLDASRSPAADVVLRVLRATGHPMRAAEMFEHARREGWFAGQDVTFRHTVEETYRRGKIARPARGLYTLLDAALPGREYLAAEAHAFTDTP